MMKLASVQLERGKINVWGQQSTARQTSLTKLGTMCQKEEPATRMEPNQSSHKLSKIHFIQSRLMPVRFCLDGPSDLTAKSSSHCHVIGAKRARDGVATARYSVLRVQ